MDPLDHWGKKPGMQGAFSWILLTDAFIGEAFEAKVESAKVAWMWEFPKIRGGTLFRGPYTKDPTI